MSTAVEEDVREHSTDDAERPTVETAAEELQLVLLPRPAPSIGLLYSLLFHAAVMVFLAFLPQILPAPTVLRNSGSEVNLAEYEPITFAGLPSLADAGGGQNGGMAGGSPGAAGGQPASAGSPKSASKAATPASPALPKTVYAGPQEIISNPPDATNTVQTIRRPDLSAAPKLKFPVRLKSMVLTRALPVPVLLAPPPNPQPRATELAATPAPAVDTPRLPVRVPQERRPRVEAREAPKLAFKQQAAPIPDVRNRALPVLAQQSEGLGTKSAVVITAVNVPMDSPTNVPDAELEGSFAVMPLRRVQIANLSPAPGVAAGAALYKGGEPGGGTAAGISGGDANSRGSGGIPNGTGTGSGLGGTGTGTGGGTGSGTAARGTGAGTGAGGTGSGAGFGAGPGRGSGRGVGPGTGTGAGSGATGGTGTGTGSGSGAGPGHGSTKLPGIVIVGGSSGGRSRFPSRAASPPPRHSYDMTIISGGASSGATRELGIFSRDETVYTVYIDMADAGGGPEYSMQYALAKPAQTNAGLLSPPFPIKKIAAAASQEQLQAWHGAGPVFVTGTVDEHGRLQDIRAVHPEDPRSTLAIAPFGNWRFEPAQLNGQPVATRILIGVTIVSAATSAGK